LGLLLARNIVALHNGSLEVTRSDLGGTLVRVVLPAATPPPSSKRSKGGPASSKRERPTMSMDAVAAQPTTKRDGWTAKPNAIRGEQPLAIRAPGPTASMSEDPPASEVDMLASTERGSALAASLIPSSRRAAVSVVITGNAAPPSTRRRSHSGPASKKRG
jgi:hypothetical protein